MKGIVTKHLNKRIQGPSINSDKLTPFNPGDEVEIIEILNGDDIDGNTVWYKLDSGIYVWSGGIKGDRDMPKPKDGERLMDGENSTPKSKIDYNSTFFQIPEKLRLNKGKGIKVAVLDSGINENHEAFKNRIAQTHNSSSSDFGMEDKTGHGSHCAGIIAANSTILTGIAPESELYVSKIVTDKDQNYTSENFISGLDWAVNTVGADVINLSFSIARIKDNQKIIKLLNDAVSKGITIVASAGENSILTFDEFTYPAMFEQIISVGAVSDSLMKKEPKFSAQLNLIMPNNEILSAGIKDSELLEDYGSSMSTAFVSGIACLIKSEMANSSTESSTSILDQINTIANQINTNSNLDNSLQLFKP